MHTHTHTVLSKTTHAGHVSSYPEGQKQLCFTWCFILWCMVMPLVFLNQRWQVGHCTSSGFKFPDLLNCLSQTPQTNRNWFTAGPFVVDSTSLHLCTTIPPWLLNHPSQSSHCTAPTCSWTSPQCICVVLCHNFSGNSWPGPALTFLRP